MAGLSRMKISRGASASLAGSSEIDLQGHCRRQDSCNRVKFSVLHGQSATRTKDECFNCVHSDDVIRIDLRTAHI